MPTFTVFKGSKGGLARESTTTKPDQLVGDTVLVKITASGVCGTDLHYKNVDMVLGHEGVGIVQEVGPEAKHLKKGDRVGWGYHNWSCGNCLNCLSGRETFCKERHLYGSANPDQGSFASHAIWHETFLHKIPEGISDEDAAPLQCGGATIFTALNGIKSTDTVAVMGVGGLGHLAIQYAAKMGCRVIVLSGSSSKKDESIRLGAHRFYSSKDLEQVDMNDFWPIDRLLVTTSVQPQWDVILPLMASPSTIYPLTVSNDKFEIPYMPLILQGINVQGSLVATRAVHREMLQFAATHQIRPVIETFPMTEKGVQESMEKLDQGKVHFRAVLIPTA